MDKVKLIAGRSNRELAQKIADALKLPLVKCKIDTFGNGEIYVEIEENIRGTNVFFIQTGAGSADGKRSINDHYVEAIEIADACIRSDAASVGIIYATFPYARSDKKDKPRVAIMSSAIAKGLKTAGYSRIICMDIHAAQTQGVVKIPFDNLYAIKLHIKNFRQTILAGLTQEQIDEQYVLVAPDMGSSKRIRAYANKLHMSHAVMDKQRDYSKASVVEKSILMGGDVKGKTAIVIDDMADTMGTMAAAARDLSNRGAKDVIVVVTHGILSGPAIELINGCEFISQVIVTDTIDQSVNITKSGKIKIVGTADVFAEVIRRLTCGGSLSELFE
ncbi:Phosphoribosylpyrophosphate synthetase [uncultured virus]|nr:Phosphoribosylpyrophosphate synthetase [uncultured virus]